MKTNTFKTAIRLVRFVRPLFPTMLFSITMGILGHLFAISMMTFAALLISSYAGMELPVSNTIIVILLLFFAISRGALHYLEQYTGHNVAFKLLAKTRANLFDSLRKLAPAKLVDKKSGDIVTSLMADIEIIEVFFAHTIAPVIIAFTLFFFLVTFFFLLHPLFALIMAISYFLVAVIIPKNAYRHAKRAGHTYREKLSSLNSFLIDSLQGMRELILFNKAGKRIHEMEKNTSDLHTSLKSIREYEGFVAGMSEFVITLSAALILISGIFLVQAGSVSPFIVVIAFVTALSSFGSFVAISALSTVVTQTFAAADRIFSLDDETPPIADTANAKEAKETVAPPLVNYQDISFSYKDNEHLLKDVSLTIKPGQKIAIMGESGSGKTTLLRLLLRFWDPDNGEISIDSDKIQSFTVDSLRKNIGTLSQDTYLFNQSIEENIKLGKKDATLDEVISASKSAEIHEFIQTLPDGYKTEVGELGGKLSGGEKQRIAIARTILKNAKLILLDEMTSSLDILNEQAILKTIEETMNDKTIITVSHRKTVAQRSDTIFNLTGVEQ